MRFSIIIPVYNVEKYIERCMQSVMEQTFRDYEVIVVDDESPDRSMDIVARWAEKYPGMVTMLHQKNTRQGGARNHGLAHARGDYVLFVDSDDYVSPRMLETVEQRLKQVPCDILVFRNQPVTPGGEPISQLWQEDLTLGIPHCPDKEPGVVLLPCGPANKAIRRELLERLQFRFPEKVLYEDGVTRLLYAAADSICCWEDVLYYYVIREDSTMRQKISPRMTDILTVTDLVLAEFRRTGLYETFRQPLEVSLIYSILCVLELINGTQPGSSIQVPLADYLTQNFPGIRENPWAPAELLRELQCLGQHRFRWYHLRYLKLNRFKDRLIQIPLLGRLRELRRRT